jgi:hypothetical protein
MKSNVAGLSLPKNWPKGVKMAVLHVISLAHVAIVHARSIVVNGGDACMRLKGDLQGALDEIALLEEELRIKDMRMAAIAAHRRPYYRPIERMAILELRAVRGWSQVQTARRFLVKPTTIASWLKRIDESRPVPLVQMREPVNKFPDLGVQGEAVSEMREGLSWPGDRTRPQTSPNCGGQESSWEASGAKGAA